MMKRLVILFCMSLIVNVLIAQELKTYKDSLSYAVGILWGQNIKQQGLTDLNIDALAKAISDVLGGEKLKMEVPGCNDMVRSYLTKLDEQEKAENLAKGNVFLEANSKRKEVITLPSGLQYEVLTKGTGSKPTANDKVTVHYQGTLIDGTVFDSSIQRGTPATFPVTGVIQGWVEALQLMEVGSKWKLFIPSTLAYGDRGAGALIGPNATLIFEVELLGIEK
jgi:FKBP-type peptidyl-prolyl cis-trans isomerase FklB